MRKSSTSMLPSGSVAVTIILKPAIVLEAGFVPWADAGIRITLRCPCPWAMWYCLITISPVYSPAAPELGCRLQPAKPVTLHNISSVSRIICW